MTETVTETRRQDLNLNLASLNSVIYVTEHRWTQAASGYTAAQLQKAQQWRVAAWLLAAVQLQLTLTWTLLHTVPWPSSVIRGVHSVDDTVKPYLQGGVSRLEGGIHWVAATYSGAMETVVSHLHSAVTSVDALISYVAKKIEFASSNLDWVFGITKTTVGWASDLTARTWHACKSLVDGLHSSLAEEDKEKEQ